MAFIEWKRYQRILFIGDSITDAQRLEKPYAPLGRGYVHFAAYFLQAKLPHLDLQIENRGVSGDTSRELLQRWKRDCLDHCPDVISILIGINDLWRHFKPVLEAHKTPVSVEEYKNNLHQMLSGAASAGCQLILMEPFFFCSDPQNPMRRDLNGYLEAVHCLAKTFQTILVPLQQSYEQVKQIVPDSQWSDDGVHPATWAHAWIAQHWLMAAVGDSNCKIVA